MAVCSDIRDSLCSATFVYNYVSLYCICLVCQKNNNKKTQKYCYTNNIIKLHPGHIYPLKQHHLPPSQTRLPFSELTSNTRVDLLAAVFRSVHRRQEFSHNSDTTPPPTQWKVVTGLACCTVFIRDCTASWKIIVAGTQSSINLLDWYGQPHTSRFRARGPGNSD